MQRTFVTCFGVVVAVVAFVGVDAAHSALKPIFSLGCDGTVDVIPNTGGLSTLLRLFSRRVCSSSARASPTRSTSGASPTVPDIGSTFSWTIPGCDSSVFNEAVLGLKEWPFGDEKVSVSWPNADSSCSATAWENGESCAMKFELAKYSISAVVKMEHCSASIWPKVTVFCEGNNCDSIGKLCNTGSDCPSSMLCWAFGISEADLWDIATEVEMYNSSVDTMPGCKSVVTMLDELKEYGLEQVFNGGSLVDSPDVQICFANITNLGDDPLGELGLDQTLFNATEEKIGCKNYCNSTIALPADFIPDMGSIPSGDCNYDRSSYYCRAIYSWANINSISYCDSYRAQLKCAQMIGCDSSSSQYSDIYSNCISGSCSDCTPDQSFPPASYPPTFENATCDYNHKDLCSYYASGWYDIHRYEYDEDINYCFKYELELNCKDQIGCEHDYSYDNCMSNDCDWRCNHTITSIVVDALDPFTGTVPSFTAPTGPSNIAPLASGSIPMLAHTGDGWIVLFPGTAFAIKLHIGHQDALTWLYSWLKAPEDCRAQAAQGSLNWWQFQARFGFMPLAAMLQLTVPTPTPSQLGPAISDFREWLQFGDGKLVIPETCSFANWRDNGFCGLKYTGLSSLLQADIMLLLSAKKGTDGMLPSVQLDCLGSGCTLFTKPVPCTAPFESTGCPAGTKCWDLDTELARIDAPEDLLAELLFKNPSAHIVSGSLHSLVHSGLSVLGSGDTSANNNYCFFSLYGTHLFDVFGNNVTYFEDWADTQYQAQGDWVSLTELSSWTPGTNPDGGSQSGDDSNMSKSSSLQAPVALLAAALLARRLLH